MKIKSITKIIYNVTREYIPKYDKTLGTSSFQSEERINIYDGIKLDGENHIKQLLKGHVAPGYQLYRDYEPSPYQLHEDESRPLAHTMYFSERDDDNICATMWRVELDFSDGPQKEQVSLTLQSRTLFLLREESAKNKLSLSNLIDEKLRLALGMDQPYSETENNYKNLLKDIQEIIKKYQI